MRKSFDSLHALVRDHLRLDVFTGHLFAFANKRRDRIKILYWDRDGLALWSGAPRELNAAELSALLSGIDLARAQRRKRYTRPA
jgi:hypothetical protein